jgi:hypothetical protein
MNKKRFAVLMLCAFIIVLVSGCAKKVMYEKQSAEVVIRNARIMTIDKSNPRAQAIAMSGEFILFVGTNKDVEKYIEKGKTLVIDAQGRLLVPGFNDAHAHFGSLNTDYLDLRYTTDPAMITQKVKERVAKARPGELISGGRWEHEMFIDKKWPTKELLDVVAPDNPVVLSRADGHSVLVNSYVLTKSGITKDTPDPPGGEIQRDPKTGEPTGIFKESASRLLRYGAVSYPVSSEERDRINLQQWEAAFEMASRLGVTSLQLPPGGGPDWYKRFYDMGKLPVRVYFGGSLSANTANYVRYLETEKQYPKSGNWIRFGYLKGFMDGTLGSGTAEMFEPFSDEPDKTGLPQMSYEDLERRVIAADSLKLQIGIHSIGDKANNWVLNAYEKAQQVNGKRDSRHRIEHAQILRLDDIPRFAQLGVIASMQPTHCITDKRFAEKRIGLERCKGAYAWKSLLNAGARIAFGTDYAVEPLDPLEGLYAGVTRKDRFNKTEPSWFPEQLLTLEETVELYTFSSAYAEFMENRKGMLKPGYLADMVLYNKDITAIRPEEIMNCLVDYTIVGGKIVYQREK